MRISTLGRKKIFQVFAFLAFFVGLTNSSAQCPTVTNPNQTFCDTQIPTVGNLNAANNGGGIRWYANAIGGVALSNTTGLTNGEDYFADDNSGSCGVRQKVVVTINSTPRPIGNSFQGPCVEDLNGATLQDFDVTGSNIKWYSNSSGGSPLPLTTIIVNGTTYYASQTDPITGCESLRKAVQAKIGLVPTPIGDPTQDFCNDPNNIPTVGSLVASGSNNWYESNGSSSPLDLTTPLVDGEDYYATTVDPPCESITRFRVDVTLIKPNDAGENGSRSICISDLGTTLPFDLYNLLGGIPDKTGTWSGPLATINGYQGTVNVASLTLVGSPYTFTYNVTSALCAPATSSVTITVLPLPTVSISSNLTLCSGSNGTVTFTGTPNATVTYTINGGNNQTILLDGSGIATISRTFTTTTTYSLVSVASSGTPSCSQAQSGTATITVLPLPTVSISSNSTICSGSSATVTFTGTPNAIVTYTVNGGINQTIVLNALGAATVTNTYNTTTTFSLVSVAYATIPVCSQSQSGTVVITVIPQPTVTISSSQSICPNTSATVTFTGTPNATVTYTVNGGSNQTIILNGTGTASITNTYNVNTTYSLVSISTATIPVCSRPQTGTSTITILPLPSVAISSNSTICSGSSATVTFTGTPNATVTYAINGGNNQTIILNGSGAATLVNTYASTTTISLVSIASSGVPSCSQPQVGEVTITVIPLPTVSLSANSSVCPNGSATVTFTGTPNATVTYTVNGGSNQIIVLNASGIATITNTFSSTTTYALVSVASATSPICSQPQTGSMTITVIPLPIVTISGNTTICYNGSATVTFTGTPDSIVTYTVNGGSNQTIALDASGIGTITNTYTVATTFTLVSVVTAGTPSCSQSQSGTITINVEPLPTVSLSSNQTICSGQSATVTFTGTPNATVTYTVNGGSNQTIQLNNVGVASIENTYLVTTVYTLVSVTSSGTPSCTQPQAGTMTITVSPPPTVTISSSQTICSGQSATITFTGTPNATVTYLLDEEEIQTIVLDASGTATITETYTKGSSYTLVSVTSAGSLGCTQPIIGEVIIDVIPLPVVTIESDVTTICSGSTATVTFTGTPDSIVTYTVNGGSNQTIALDASGIGTITNTYTVATTFTLVSTVLSGSSSCTQPQVGEIIINVEPLPTVTISSSQTICSGQSATITFTGTPNATVTYLLDEEEIQTIVLDASGTATITETYTKGSSYTLVSVTSAGSLGCTQPIIGEVIIDVIPLPVVTIESDVTTICSGSTATVTFTGTPDSIVTYTVNGGSNQTIALDASGIGTITNTYTVATTFTLVSVATAGTPSCSQSQSGTITINVEPLPIVSLSSNQTICSGQSATVTFTGTPNATVTYTVNGGSNQTIQLNNVGVASIENTYLVTTVYTLVSVTSSGTPSCTQPQAGTMTITVSPPPTVTISSSQTICSGQSATITFTGTPNATVTYLLDEEEIQTIVLDASGTATITETYTKGSSYTLVSVTSAGSLGCTQPIIGEVIIDVIPLPVVTIESDVTTICSGSTATVTFTGTPDSIVTYTVNGGSNQTIALDASGIGTITNTYTVATTFTLVSTVLSGSSSCTQPQVGEIIINVEPLPTVTISSSQTICSGQSATITFTGTPNATVTYLLDEEEIQTIVLDASGTATITETYTKGSSYTLVSVTSAGSLGCTQPIIGEVIIDVIPLPVVTIESDVTTICSGSTATVTFTGTPDSIVTYTVNGGSNQTIALDASGIGTITNTYTVATTFTLVSVATAGTPSCSQSQSGTITINVEPLPIVSLSSNQTICSGQSATVTFTGTPNATVTYTVNGGSNQTIQLNNVGVASIENTYLVTTVYTLVSVTSSGTPSCTQPQAGTMTITVSPPPTVTISSSQTICSGQSATITFTGTPNATVTYLLDEEEIQTIVLDASGTATITETYTKGSSYTLVSVTSAGSLGCTQPIIGEVIIDVIPLPVVTIESDVTTICSGSTATVTFTGTPDSIVTYTVNGGSNQTIALDASGIGTITNTYTVATTFTLVSTVLSGSSSCTQPQVGEIIINVEPLPTVTISSSQTICSGSTATITFTGTPNATVTYTVNGGSDQTILIDNNGLAILKDTYTSTTVFSLVSITTTGSPGCSNPQTSSTTITVLPLPIVAISADASVCSGSNAKVTFTGTPNATVTYTINGGNNQTLLIDSVGQGEINSVIATTTTYTLVSVESQGTPICSNPLTDSVTIAINPLPTATVSSSPTVCSGTNTTVTFTGTPNSIVKYNVNGGNNQTIPIGPSGIAVLNTSLNVTSTYTLVSITLANPPSCTQLLSYSTTSTVTLPPVAGSNASLPICSESNLQDLFLLLGSNAQPGGTWSPALASGTGVFNPLVDSAGSYVYTVAGTPPCVNDTALVTVSIIAAPNAGTNTNVNLCSNADSIDLITLLGGNPQSGGTWSPGLVSGSGLFDPSKDVAGTYTYSVGGTSPCLNATASVTITVLPGLNAGLSGTTTFCPDSPPKDLFLSLGGIPQVGGTWSPALASGTGIFNPTVDKAGIYTYAFSGTEPCSNDSATVTVTLNPLPDAGEDAIANICSNNDSKDLFTFLAGTPQLGGTWSPALASGTGIFNPAVDKAGIYTYTVGNPFCNPDSAVLTVNIIPGPDAGVSGNVTFCINNAPQDLFLSLGGTPQIGGTWSPSLASGTGIFNPAVDKAGVYTYTFVGNQPCDDDTATVTVKVDPISNAGTFGGIQNICNSASNLDLFTLLSGYQAGGVWKDPNNQSVSNPIDVSKLTPNTYSYTYTITNSCGSDSETVQFNILNNPVLAATNIAVSSSNCKGSNVIVTLSNMIDGKYTINYNLSLANILSNQNVNVTIVNGSGTFTINAADIPNVGTTRVSFLSITNVTTTCITLINPNVSADFIIKPSSNLENKNIVISDICIGSPLKVDISGATSGLADGTYQFVYTIPNATPTTGNSGVVTIASGAGQFTVPASYFASAGDYTFTITSITNLSSACNNLSEDATASFQVFPIPDATGTVLNAASACLNFSNEVFITGANNLSDGIYTIKYQLSGANTANSSVSIPFVNGKGSFSIPASDLNNSGNTTITLTDLTSNVSQCGTSASTVSPFTFAVTELETPEIIPSGNEFCGPDNPTIEDLSANITTVGTIIWYDAPSDGQVFNSTDLLEDGNTYYGAIRSASGCESTIRLEVTVDLNQCKDILIPDGFSPNGDKINDEFVIKNIENKYPNYRLEIYNRYGNILYKGNRNIPNWDGTTTQGGIKFGDSKVPVGVYFYILEFNDGSTKPKQGRLYLSR